MRKVIGFVLCLVLGVLLATQVHAAAPMELAFWGGWTGPDGDVMRAMVDQYNARNPDVHVTLTTLQWTPLFDKFLISMRAGEGPDLMAMHPQDTAQFIDGGLLEPLTAFGANVQVKAGDFDKNAWGYSSYKDTQYAVPLDFHMHGLYYNVDLFKQAGLDPTHPPTTGDAFIEAARRLTIDAAGRHPGDAGFDAKNVKQYGVAFPNNHHAFYIWYALVHQQGAGFSIGGTQVNFDDAQGIAAWKWEEDLIFKHQVVPVGESNPAQDFLTGRTAMLFDGPWQMPAMQKQQGLNWATAPFPTVFGRSAVWGSGHILTVPKQRDRAKQVAALDLAQWIVRNSDFWATSGNIPVFRLASETDRFRRLQGRAAFVSMLPYEVILPNIVKSAQVFSAAAPSPIVQAAQAATLRNEDPATIVRTLRQRIDGVLAAP
jgi:multiple sugar transport system substrate-binding protein